MSSKKGEKRRKEEEEDLSSYWITLKNIRFWNLKEEALGPLWKTGFKEAVDLSQERTR